MAMIIAEAAAVVVMEAISTVVISIAVHHTDHPHLVHPHLVRALMDHHRDRHFLMVLIRAHTVLVDPHQVPFIHAC